MLTPVAFAQVLLAPPTPTVAAPPEPPPAPLPVDPPPVELVVFDVFFPFKTNESAPVIMLQPAPARMRAAASANRRAGRPRGATRIARAGCIRRKATLFRRV